MGDAEKIKIALAQIYCEFDHSQLKKGAKIIFN